MQRTARARTNKQHIRTTRRSAGQPQERHTWPIDIKLQQGPNNRTHSNTTHTHTVSCTQQSIGNTPHKTSNTTSTRSMREPHMTYTHTSMHSRTHASKHEHRCRHKLDIHAHTQTRAYTPTQIHKGLYIHKHHACDGMQARILKTQPDIHANTGTHACRRIHAQTQAQAVTHTHTHKTIKCNRRQTIKHTHTLKSPAHQLKSTLGELFATLALPMVLGRPL